MVLGAYPIGKILVLGVKHVTQPVAQIFQTYAKHNPIFRKWLCIPAGQFIHWTEVRCKMRMLKLPQPKKVPRLREDMATDLGANLIGELFVIAIGVALIYHEVVRQLESTKKKHESHENERRELERKISTLNNLVEWQDEELKNVRMILNDNDSH